MENLIFPKTPEQSKMCKQCGEREAYRDGKCSKCFVSENYGDQQEDFDQDLGQAPKENMPMHSNNLKQVGLQESRAHRHAKKTGGSSKERWEAS